MEPAVSQKLDALRFVAALAVVAAHASQLAYSGAGNGALVAYGRLGVVAFFVLSGYVIAFVCEHKHDTGTGYAIARVARLHSVLVPALLLTWGADAMGRSLAPALYSSFPSPWSGTAMLSGLTFPTFMNQSLGHGFRWLSNGPLWSIAYEFWYYALYGVWRFTRGRRRILLLVAAMLLAGPRILLLFPLWLAGVLIYRQRNLLAAINIRSAAWCGCVGAALLAWACSLPAWRATEGMRQAGAAAFGQNYSSFLFWDLFILLPVCMVMVAAIHPLAMAPNDRAGRVLQRLAGGTFSIYCFHVPLLLLFRASNLYDSDSAPQAVLAAVLALAACLALGQATEARKGWWVRFWTKMADGRFGAVRHA